MKTVFLNSGHGGADPGAVSGNMLEKNINLVAMLKCKEELERHNIKVVCSKLKDEDDKLVEVVKEANSSGADIAISFHANAGGGDGFEAFYYTGSASGKKLASLGEKYVKELGQNSRGLKSGNHLYFVKNTKAPAVLFESFFVDNVKDRTIGDTIIKQQAFGIAYAKAILEYFGIEYKKLTVDKTPTYYKKYTGVSTTLDVVLKAVGVPEKYRGSWSKRKPVAKKNGISVYIGSATQNKKLITLAKQGKLKRV
jgi:N-acetylmuramoyl-L-alanine amidase